MPRCLVRRRRRARDGGAGHRQPVRHRRAVDHRRRRRSREAAAASCGASGETADAVVAARPDALVIIDSPDFTHRVARRVRKAAPDIPIINYAPPSVWAWRPWRARAMRALRRRGAGDPAVRAGRVRAARRPALHLCGPSAGRADRATCGRTPRRRGGASPIRRWCWCCREAGAARSAGSPAIFGARDRAGGGSAPDRSSWCCRRCRTSPRRSREATADWPVRPRIVTDAAEKYAAFRTARAALAASGTVTLELALAQVPMVAAYRIAAWEARDLPPDAASTR